MQEGSIVETVGDFEDVRRQWGFEYPRKGDVLTVSSVVPHGNPECRRRGIVLLNFVELPNLVGVCDRDINNEPNFVELSIPDSIEKEISESLNLIYV